MDAPQLIPIAVERQLIMNFVGFRLRDRFGVWGNQFLFDEEQLGLLPPELWNTYVTLAR
jgi:hypothetical protein